MITRRTHLLIYEQDGYRIHDTVNTWYIFGVLPFFRTQSETQRRGTVADEALRQAVFRADDWECVYCGKSERPGLTVDHLVPQSNGGATVFENLVTACARCNSTKNARTPESASMPLSFGRFLRTQYNIPPEMVRSYRQIRTRIQEERARKIAQKQHEWDNRVGAVLDAAVRGDIRASQIYTRLTKRGFICHEEPD